MTPVHDYRPNEVVVRYEICEDDSDIWEMIEPYRSRCVEYFTRRELLTP